MSGYIGQAGDRRPLRPEISFEENVTDFVPDGSSTQPPDVVRSLSAICPENLKLS